MRGPDGRVSEGVTVPTKSMRAPLEHVKKVVATSFAECCVNGGIMRAVVTVRLELEPEIEANLAAQARVRGMALDAYLQGVIEDLARREAARPASLHDLEATLDVLAEMGRDLPHLPSTAFSRESIYRDHD